MLSWSVMDEFSIKRGRPIARTGMEPYFHGTVRRALREGGPDTLKMLAEQAKRFIHSSSTLQNPGSGSIPAQPQVTA